MNFLICADGQFREELDGIANGLMANGNEVGGFASDIYKADEERSPDVYIFTPNHLNQPDIQHFLKNKPKRYIVVNSEQIVFSEQNFINLPSFASTMKYTPQLPVKDLECDIAMCFDGLFPDRMHAAYNKLYKNYRVKMIGAFINCMGYIGMGNPADLVKLAKSAKITVSNNKIMTASLLYNNICAVDMTQLELIDKTEEELEQYVLDNKKGIITDIQLGKMISEKLSNSNR